MRFMILLKADRNTEAGVPPSTELIAAMTKNDLSTRQTTREET
jgi:hypothetical protein